MMAVRSPVNDHGVGVRSGGKGWSVDHELGEEYSGDHELGE
jgi:hypothetical protein